MMLVVLSLLHRPERWVAKMKFAPHGEIDRSRSIIYKAVERADAACAHFSTLNEELAVDVPNVAPTVCLLLHARDPKVIALIPPMPFLSRHKVGVETITLLHLAEDNVTDRDLFNRRDGFVTAPVAGVHPRFGGTHRAHVSNRLARQQHTFQLGVSLLSTPFLGWPIRVKRLVNILLRTNFARPVDHHWWRPIGLRRDP